MSPREPGATAVAALERSLLPFPQCTGRRRQQHHRPASGLRRPLRGPRARGALAAARGAPGSDGEAPASRPRLRRPARPAPPGPALLPARQPGRFLVGAGGRQARCGLRTGGGRRCRGRHGRVPALHKGRGPAGWGGGPAAGCQAAGRGCRGREGRRPAPPLFRAFPTLLPPPAPPPCCLRPRRRLPLSGGGDGEGGGGRPASGYLWPVPRLLGWSGACFWKGGRCGRSRAGPGPDGPALRALQEKTLPGWWEMLVRWSLPWEHALKITSGVGMRCHFDCQPGFP